MKIAYISGAYVPGREANSMHVMGMCNAMARLGHEVTLHVRPGEKAQGDDFDFYGVPPSFRIAKHARPQVRIVGALVNAWHVGRALSRDARPDLVYARELYGLLLVARSGAPFVYESHWRPKHRVQRELEAFLFRQSNFRLAVFISDALRDIYRREFPWLPEERMLVAHDAADPRALAEHSEEDGDRLQVGYVGGFLPGYGIDVIVELARRRADMDFHIVGGKEAALREWRPRTAHLDNLTFHGFVEPAKLSGFYRRFHVVLAPYQRGTAHIEWISPMKLFEYMAEGKAIICSDFPVIREIMRDDENSLIVRADAIAQWERALDRLSDATLRTRLAKRARLDFDGKHTWLHRAKHVLAAIR